MFRARIVLHFHGGNYDGFYHSQGRVLRFFIIKTLLQADCILVLGEGLRRMYDFEPRLASRIDVVSNGLPIDLQPTRKVLPEPGAGRPLELLYLSNMIQTKGYWDVLQAVRELKDVRGLTVRCRFAGRFLASSDDAVKLDPAEAEQRFLNAVADMGLGGQVDYIGPVAGDTKWALLRNAHFFLLPTRYVNEGQPVCIIEAMAHGCVTITTAFRAIPELIADGESGVIVDYGAPEQIADAITSLAGDPKRYAAMSSAATECYARSFTMKAHLNRVVPHIMGSQ
jgi:glycosyltransferase involved in cell wall biosynthesis